MYQRGIQIPCSASAYDCKDTVALFHPIITPVGNTQRNHTVSHDAVLPHRRNVIYCHDTGVCHLHLGILHDSILHRKDVPNVSSCLWHRILQQGGRHCPYTPLPLESHVQAHQPTVSAHSSLVHLALHLQRRSVLRRCLWL